MNLGDKTLAFRNPEDMTTAYTLEVTDVFEVSHSETYYEITQKEIQHVRKNQRISSN